jgi:hypothetical protein
MSDKMEKAPERDVGDDLHPREMVGKPEQVARNDGSILERGQRHEDEIHPNSDGGEYLKPNDSDGSSKHAYIDKKVDNATGTVTYFYENGVRSIHHPDMLKNNPAFHNRQAEAHRKQAQDSSFFDNTASRSHLTAAHGHDLAASSKEKYARRNQEYKRVARTWAERVGSEDEGKTVPELDEIGRPVQGKPATPRNRPRRSADSGPVENLEKSHLSVFTNFLDKQGAIGTVDGMGTVAVSSDPGVFSPTYGERSPIKQKKKKSGVAKLDQFLRTKNKKVEKFATDVVQGALQDLREYDIMKIDDDKYGEDERVVDKAEGVAAPKAAIKQKQEPKPEKQPSEPKPQKVTSPRSIYKAEDSEEFFSLFKDYFEYLDKEEESTDDSRDGEERLDSEETSRGDLD